VGAIGAFPTLSEVRRWGTGHLTEAADNWTKTATVWEDQFTELVSRVAAPGGSPWEGRAADTAQHRAHSDRMTAIGLADQLHTASRIARRGATEITEARRLALRTVASAKSAGFTVGENFSVTDPQLYDAHTAAVRQAQAEAFAADLRARVGVLVATDSSVAGELTATTAGLGTSVFPESGGMAPLHNRGEPDARMVRSDRPLSPADDGPGDSASDSRPEGLPPDGVRPPVEGPLTQGDPSRPSAQGRGGRSLWDENGGEWRYFPGDEWHNPHWDYNSHTNPRSRWDNIPINGMPPRIGEEVPGLPPWMQGAPSSPPQNPLTVPYPDVSAPLPPTGPPRDPGMGPDVTLPYIDIPLPDPAAGGPAVVAGGGALLLLILGALAVA